MAKTHGAWIAQLRKLTADADDIAGFDAALLRWQSSVKPDYVDTLAEALALAHLLGRSAVPDEIGIEFSSAKIGTVPFKEAQEFLRKKVSLPSTAWGDLMHSAHDRAFVIAGADSVALVEDLRGALTRAMEGGGGLEAFRKEFDEIVLKQGWQYNGGRNWRTRVIYETNLRSAHQAGRLKQMRHPEIVKHRPFWRYIHGYTHKPKTPRDEHLAWHNLCLPHDDPIWNQIFAPNGWLCGCSIVTISHADLKRLGKSGPDRAPKLKMRKARDPVTGEIIELPEGIDLGWSYMPGDTWERGLVPREWQKPLSQVQPELPLPVSPPLSELGKPFATGALKSGQASDYYVARFLNRFGAAIGKGILWRDAAGHALVISDQLFRNADGAWKTLKRDRAIQVERLAEAIFDPDEIWIDWARAPDGTMRLQRSYLRWDPQLAAFATFKFSKIGWSGVTMFDPRRGKQNRPNRNYLEKSRRGALLYRRGAQSEGE